MKIIKITAAALCAALLAGCGGSSGGTSSDSVSFVSNNSAYESKSEEAYESMEMPAEEMAIPAGDYDIKYEAESDPAELSEKIVYSGDLMIQTRDYQNAAKALRDRVLEFGGLIESENEYSDGGYYEYNSGSQLWTLYITVRIPTEKFGDFMSGTADIGNVISRSSSAVNISKRYNDVSAQIEALEIQQKRLLEMMDQAVSIEDMIAVETRLSDVQYQLNSLKTDRESMDTDVAYSTVRVTLREVRVYSETSESFFTKLSNRFVNGFAGFADAMADLVLAIVYVIPYILLACILIFIFRKTSLAKKIHMPHFFRKKKEPLE